MQPCYPKLNSNLERRPALKRHHYLFAGEVIFLQPDESIGNIRLNTVLRTTDEKVRARNIGEAQQALQMLFLRKMENVNVKVIDVFIFSVSYLGLMTEADFQKPPEGTKLEELIPVANDPFMQ